jgi:hypothetical protein
MMAQCVPMAICGHVHHITSAQSSAASCATGSFMISSSVLVL